MQKIKQMDYKNILLIVVGIFMNFTAGFGFGGKAGILPPTTI